ncbi:MAG: ATPase, T2SS/T4P/T4SS family [Patescibacteria group bacterium]|jgi:type IV pilus assembly protein PilB
MDIFEKNRSIEDVLYDKKLITADQLSAVKFESVNTGVSPKDIIKERGYVSDADFIKAYGEVYGFDFIDLNELRVDPALMEFLPVALAKKLNAIPFQVSPEDKQLSLAMVDPLDLPTIEFVEKKSGYKVIPYIASEESMKKVIEDLQGKAIGEEISAALEEINQTTLKIEENAEEISEATLRDAPIARIVGMILETAVKTGASDIHIEPYEDKTRLRYRIDGVLEEKRTIPKEMHDSIVARIKILGKMKIDEKRLPLDGRFKVQVGNTFTDLRISTLPTVNGEKVVIRLLKEEGAVFSFKDLGLRGLSLKRVEEAILKPTGMMLVTGPTGSGKTLTLASALNKLNTVRVNISTLEDPVEIRLPGVNQVQVNVQAGLTFANGLRSFLRQDPNIIMVGEIRDNETAELAIQAALTGHLVLSTLHTNSSSGALPRLLDMGVQSFLLVSTVNAIVAQRLVRRICSECKEEYDPPEEVQEDVKRILESLEASKVSIGKDASIAESVKKVSTGNIKLYRGRGCEKCSGTGYKGRLGIFEVLEMNEDIARLVLENASADQIEKAAIKDGMLTLMQDGALRVVEGATTLEEVMRVAK